MVNFKDVLFLPLPGDDDPIWPIVVSWVVQPPASDWQRDPRLKTFLWQKSSPPRTVIVMNGLKDCQEKDAKWEMTRVVFVHPKQQIDSRASPACHWLILKKVWNSRQSTLGSSEKHMVVPCFFMPTCSMYHMIMCFTYLLWMEDGYIGGEM